MALWFFSFAKLAFRSPVGNLRLDRVTISQEGIDVLAGVVPVIGTWYEPFNKLIPWADVVSIEAPDENDEHSSVIISLASRIRGDKEIWVPFDYCSGCANLSEWAEKARGLRPASVTSAVANGEHCVAVS